MAGLLKAYQRILYAHPYKVQILQTGLLMASGDILSQRIVERKKNRPWDPVRTFQFFVVGIGFVAPVSIFWYRILAKYVGSGGGTVAIKKVILDQFCACPILLAVCLCVLKAVQGYGIEDMKEELRKNYFDMLKANYMVWPAIQMFNFYLIPLNYQVLLVQCVSLLWNAYVSFKTRN